jgi:hypothetical protein
MNKIFTKILSAFDKIGAIGNNFSLCQFFRLKIKSNGERTRRHLDARFGIIGNGGSVQSPALRCLSFSGGAGK